MRSSLIIVSLLCLAAASISLQAEDGETIVQIRVPKPESADDVRYAYYYDLLKMALEKTAAAEGPCRLVQSAHAMSFQGRGLRYLKQGRDIDVLWMMTCKDRERDLLPVRIPLLKGLLGCRVFLIREGEQAAYDQIMTLDQLRQKRAGQGFGWPDVEILEANGLDVVIGRHYENLFNMLEHGRFDYFPRGVCEAWEEDDQHGDMPIQVEQHIVLHYPTAIYFFVNRQNELLARRLEAGLRICLQDGSFDRLFNDYHGKAIATARLKSRRVFRLENPFLPKETPVQHDMFWLDVLADLTDATP